MSCTSSSFESTQTLHNRVDAKELLLDVQAFPIGWTIGSCAPDCQRSEGATEAARSFYIVGVAGHVLQDVFRFETIQAAQQRYQTYRNVDFRERQPPNTQFIPPATMNYQGSIADEYYIGCGIDEIPACRALLRYGQYVVSMYFDIASNRSDGLQLADIPPILSALDQRVAKQVGIIVPTATPISVQ